MTKKEQPLSHELVPEHTVLSGAKKKEVLEKFGISEAQLPRIQLRDPALIGKSPKIGDLILIARKDSVAQYDYYRLVVKG